MTRKKFLKSIQTVELQKARFKCRKCNKKLEYPCFEFNHKDGDSSNSSQENCQVLCLCCHRKITIKQIKDIPRTEFVRRAKKAWRDSRSSWEK